MRSGSSPRLFAIAGRAVFTIVESSVCMKKPVATIHSITVSERAVGVVWGWLFGFVSVSDSDSGMKASFGRAVVCILSGHPLFASGLLVLPLCGAAPPFLCCCKEKGGKESSFNPRCRRAKRYGIGPLSHRVAYARPCSKPVAQTDTPRESNNPTQRLLRRIASARVRSGAHAARRLKGSVPLRYPGRHRRLKPLSFAYFSLRLQRKVGAAPHRGNANKPEAKSGCQRSDKAAASKP